MSNLIDLTKNNPLATPFSPAKMDETKQLIAKRNIAYAAASGAKGERFFVPEGQ